MLHKVYTFRIVSKQQGISVTSPVAMRSARDVTSLSTACHCDNLSGPLGWRGVELSGLGSQTAGREAGSFRACSSAGYLLMNVTASCRLGRRSSRGLGGQLKLKGVLLIRGRVHKHHYLYLNMAGLEDCLLKNCQILICCHDVFKCVTLYFG